MNASRLRSDLYRILDQALDTGVPIEIERKGRKLRIVPDVARSRLDRLVPHPEALVGDPDDLVSMDWSGSWKP